MKSEWMVSQVFAWGMKEPEYQVYRNIDKMAWIMKETGNIPAGPSTVSQRQPNTQNG